MSQIRPNTSFLYIAALICLLAVGLFMFSKSDFFAVDDIRIEGLNNITEDEVIRLMGAVKGENVFLADTEALAQKIKLHPLVAKAEVSKKLPGSLVFKIQERLPAALILTKEGMVEVDSQGVLLRFYDTWPKKDCPVLTGVEVPETLGPGQKISNPQLEKGLLVIGQAPEGLSSLYGEVHIGTDDLAFIYLTTGVEVRLGHSEDFSAKLKLLKELLNSQEYKTVEKGIKYIDLTAGKPVLGR